jgi:hypothetical protein
VTALSILYRGPLASCNYGCAYCPFGKKVDSSEALRTDRTQWERFVDWVAARPAGDELGVFVTPWGEALTRRWYQDGLARLSRLPQVVRAAVQTNLSAPLDWLAEGDTAKLGLWCTYHPEWTSRERFLAQCARLSGSGVSYSVGVVGFASHMAEAVAVRDALPADVYVWINAVKSTRYTEDEVAAWERIDPLFRWNLPHYPSRGKACAAGERAIAVDGDGTMRRCHFVSEPIGNLYAADWAASLVPRPCTAETCKCHIGYVHLEYLELDKLFGSGLLHRVPPRDEWKDGARRLPVLGSSRLLRL